MTFARKIFFQVSSLLKFRKMPGKCAMDTLNVRKAHWVTKVPWLRWSVARCRQAIRFVPGVLLCPFCQDCQGTIVSIDQSLLDVPKLLKYLTKNRFCNKKLLLQHWLENKKVFLLERPNQSQSFWLFIVTLKIGDTAPLKGAIHSTRISVQN